MWEDPIVSEVRKVREQLAAQFNFDIGAIFAEMRRRQITLGAKLVTRQIPEKAEQAAAPDRDSAALYPGR